MFTHTTTLYDVLKQPLALVTSLPSSCDVFFNTDIQRAIWEMNTSKAAIEEGFQAEFFKLGIYSLVDYIVDLFNHVVCSGFP
jgi:hypothetical protein